MALSPRYALDTLTVVAGGFTAVAALTFTPHTTGWVAFGVATATALAAITALLFTHRTAARIGHGALALTGLWSLVAALTFQGHTLTWLAFADALALTAVALADLTAHELSTERVVHALDIPATAPASTAHHIAA
jgi:hypothetical protein